MSLTYGYDLKEGDEMIASPVQAFEMLIPLIMPGAALVNNLPFCETRFVSVFIWRLTVIPSEVYSFVGTMAQLQTIGTNSQEAE
jgi:hypothetical protein